MAKHISVSFLVFLAVVIGISCKKMNVLFLVSDDLRPELGAYLGSDFPSPIHPKIYTPNIDALANKSLLLKRAHVQLAVCSPSRASLLTGRRPDTTRVHDLIHYWRKVGGNFTTIPQYFKENGYITAGMGKVFHPGAASGQDDPISWTEPYFHGSNAHWVSHSHQTWYAADVDEVKKHPLPDQQIISKAIEALKKYATKGKTGEQPFFLAAGMHRPHLPWLFPANFLDYYPEGDIKLPDNPYAPVNMPEVAWSFFQELRELKDIGTKYGYGAINTTLPDKLVLQLRRAYYASVSYVDSLVGEVVKAVDDLGLSDSTIISFWGDHGWQLGEHGEWAKHTNFELCTHAPMMVHVPGLTDHGVITEQLTEFVDLFPTLVEAAGLPHIPLCPEKIAHVETCTEGVSFVPLMKDPKRTWKKGAFSQYPRLWVDGDYVMGYSVRTDQYRFTDWSHYDDYTCLPIWSRNRGRELYDHAIDPEENHNVVNDKKYKNVVKTLQELVRAGWRSALPPNVTSGVSKNGPNVIIT